MMKRMSEPRYKPNPILEQIRSSQQPCGFDVLRGQYGDVMAANIVDPVRVLYTALQTGVSGAMMGLTTAVLVHKPRINRDEAVDFLP